MVPDLTGNPFTYFLPAVIRLYIGYIFLWSSIAKLRNAPNFVATIDQIKLLPLSSKGVAGLVIGVELLLACWLIVGWMPAVSLSLALILLVIFTYSLKVLKAKVDYAGCACFGGSTIHSVKVIPFIRNIWLCAAIALALIMQVLVLRRPVIVFEIPSIFLALSLIALLGSMLLYYLLYRIEAIID